ncbi:hypothetical protein OROGR_026994 [Orobanche gracilis]
MKTFPIFLAVIVSLHLPVFVASSKLIPHPSCKSSDSTALRSDQMTVMISGYSERRIPLLHSIAAAYSSAPTVAAVLLLWCNPSTPPKTLSDLTRNLTVSAVLRAPSSSLNYRFYPWEMIKTKAVLICDDDIEPDPRSVSFAFAVWRSDPDRAVGFFARSHGYDVALRTWVYTMERGKYSIILTKFMIVNTKYLVKYSCDEEYVEARRIVEDMNNCEDILMNFVVAEENQKGPVMVGAKGGGVRDYGDARNDGVAEGLRAVGLSSRTEEHMKRRGECIREFHKILGRMPLKYSYGKMVDDVGEQGLCEKGGKLVLCDQQNFRWPNRPSDAGEEIGEDAQLKDLFLPFRVFCTRKDIQCFDVVLEDIDVAKGIIEFVKQSAIDVLVLGATVRGSIFRFKAKDIPGSVLKGAPDFCTIYVINKGKISSTRAACRPAPSILSPLRNQMMYQANSKIYGSEPPPIPSTTNSRSSFSGHPRPVSEQSPCARQMEFNTIKSPFTHRRGPNGKAYELTPPETDISFVSSSTRRSVEAFPVFSESSEGGPTPPRLSGFSDMDYSDPWGRKSVDILSPLELSASSPENERAFTAQTMDEVEAEMRRLKQELKQTMDMYSTACKEALSAREKAMELQRWKMEEQKKLEEARLAEEAALALAEKEKAKSKAAIEHAEAAQRLAELEAQKRINAEMKALKEAEEKSRVLNSLAQSDARYRKYTIEEIEVATEYFAQSRKIGEGGYGPVYKCYLDHTPVAVKVLRPDATQGRSQFQQEVEILCCIRHPNMVLLLGACPEYGCLVYEYMSNGSLEDRLFQRGKTPPLSWQHRFRIAAEIGTGLLFLHQAKPEPLVHRDLKPANILLDRNYVSKISDVGLARLVPPSIADTVTQYRMTSTAGTFCYIDPEYQQTGMLGVKSDIYSLGIIFLQILTGKPPMGLTHHVDRAIERGTFVEMLDPSVLDWPVEEALVLAKLALKCSELRRKDRPDLGKVVLPLLNKLRDLAEDSTSNTTPYCGNPSPRHSQVSMTKEDLSFPPSTQSSMGSSYAGRE